MSALHASKQSARLHVDLPSTGVGHRWPGLSERDRTILTLTRGALSACAGTFREALLAMGGVVERIIPNGRIFLLGHHTLGPIVGSLISGVGIAEEHTGVVVVHVSPTSEVTVLGRLLL